MEVEIRVSRPGDGPAMGRIHVESWAVAYRGLMSDEFLDGRDPARVGKGWERQIAEDPTPHLVAVHNDEVVAMMTVGPYRGAVPGDPSGEVLMLNCLPDHFGTGAATRLHTAGVEALREAGHGSAALWVVDKNPRARRFYEREGWKADGATKKEDFEGVEITELRYVIEL